jgi:hypothetical protein
LAAEPGTSFTIMSQGNLSSLPDTCVFRTREGGLGILQVTGQTANPPGLKVRYKFADPIPTASPADAGGTAADWSPNLLPGEKPNFPKILEEAKSLTATGHYAEALQRFLWEHRHAPESDDSYQKIVRLTSALTDWVELGRRYAPAKQALLEIRDADTREIAAGRGYGDLFQTVQAINRELQDDDATWALFKTMVKTDRQLAGQCYYYAEDLLLQKGEYALCLEFLGDPQANFEGIRRSLEMQTSSQQQMEERRKRFPQPAPPVFKGVFRPFDMGQMATNNFVGRVGKLVEVLVGAGDPATAVKIRDEAVAVLDDPRLRSSVSEAEANLKKHPVPVTNSETK